MSTNLSTFISVVAACKFYFLILLHSLKHSLHFFVNPCAIYTIFNKNMFKNILVLSLVLLNLSIRVENMSHYCLWGCLRLRATIRQSRQMTEDGWLAGGFCQPDTSTGND